VRTSRLEELKVTAKSSDPQEKVSAQALEGGCPARDDAGVPKRAERTRFGAVLPLWRKVMGEATVTDMAGSGSGGFGGLDRGKGE
jgi:hypothetical protein